MMVLAAMVLPVFAAVVNVTFLPATVAVYAVENFSWVDGTHVVPSGRIEPVTAAPVASVKVMSLNVGVAPDSPISVEVGTLVAPSAGDVIVTGAELGDGEADAVGDDPVFPVLLDAADG